MMLAHRLAAMVEAHSDALANSLVERAQDSSSTRGYHKLPLAEPRQRVHEIYDRWGERRRKKEDTDRERAKAPIEIAPPKFRGGLIRYCERAPWPQHAQTVPPAVTR